MPNIALSDLRNIIAARPKQTNRRILAQQGAFLIFGLRTILSENNNSGIQVIRHAVPADSKKNILNELDTININASSLFPEIEAAAKYIISKIPPPREPDEASD